MLQKSRPALMAKPLIITWGVGLVMMMALATVASMASAQQPQTSGSKSGTIVSIQDGKNGMPEWILSGVWDFKNVNSSSPTFNSTFIMVMLNGTALHKHRITDFKMTGSPTKSGMVTTYNGTATVTLALCMRCKIGVPIPSVPVSIKLAGPVISVWIDPTKIMNHYGNTPIYGMVD